MSSTDGICPVIIRLLIVASSFWTSYSCSWTSCNWEKIGPRLFYHLLFSNLKSEGFNSIIWWLTKKKWQKIRGVTENNVFEEVQTWWLVPCCQKHELFISPITSDYSWIDYSLHSYYLLNWLIHYFKAKPNICCFPSINTAALPSYPYRLLMTLPAQDGCTDVGYFGFSFVQCEEVEARHPSLFISAGLTKSQTLILGVGHSCREWGGAGRQNCLMENLSCEWSQHKKIGWCTESKNNGSRWAHLKLQKPSQKMTNVKSQFYSEKCLK